MSRSKTSAGQKAAETRRHREEQMSPKELAALKARRSEAARKAAATKRRRDGDGKDAPPPLPSSDVATRLEALVREIVRSEIRALAS